MASDRTPSAAQDREWTGSWVLDAGNRELADAIRKAVMISMSLTGSVGTYTHDNYDDAMAALNELQRRANAGHADF